MKDVRVKKDRDALEPPQKEHYERLCRMCRKYGVNPMYMHEENKRQYEIAVSAMSYGLRKIGIEPTSYDKNPRYRLDPKTGDVIDSKTGKIIRKEGETK